MKVVFLGNFDVSYSSETHHAKSLQTLGHDVVALQEGRVTTEQVSAEALRADLFVWVHTHGWNTPGPRTMRDVLRELRDRGIPSLTYHLDLWLGISRQKDMQTDDYWDIEHFFTVDKLMADWLTENTPVKGHYLQAGVYHKECRMVARTVGRPPVAFVGSYGYHPEWQYRRQLIDWLQSTYGPQFRRYAGDVPPERTVRGGQLNEVYCSTKVAVGDSLCLNFDYPHYWSDRVYETLGRGGFIIHPYIRGMEEHFEDGKHLRFYEFGNFTQLKELIDFYLEHDRERELIRYQGHHHVASNHTYLNRWQTILRAVAE